MNPEIKAWLVLFGSLALETTAVLAVAAIIAARMRHGSWRRFVWQGGLCAALVVSLLEISGASRALTLRLRGWSQPAATAAVQPIMPPTQADGPTKRKVSVRVFDAPASATAKPEMVAADPVSYAPWILAVWSAGFMFVLGRSLMSRLAFSLSRRKFATPVTLAHLLHQTEQLAALVGMRRPVRVFEMEHLPAPIAWGIARPALGFPTTFCADYSEAQREVMILHELAHLQANDPLWLIVSDAVLALLWWHPAAWWARHEFRAACELAADEMSLRLEQGPERLAEGLVILGKKLPISGGLVTLGMAGSGFRSALGLRVERLLQLGGTRVRPIGSATRIAAGAVALGLAGLIACGATTLQTQTGSARTLPDAWHASPLGRTFALLQAPAEPVKATRQSKAEMAPTRTADPIQSSTAITVTPQGVLTINGSGSAVQFQVSGGSTQKTGSTIIGVVSMVAAPPERKLAERYGATLALTPEPENQNEDDTIAPIQHSIRSLTDGRQIGSSSATLVLTGSIVNGGHPLSQSHVRLGKPAEFEVEITVKFIELTGSQASLKSRFGLDWILNPVSTNQTSAIRSTLRLDPSGIEAAARTNANIRLETARGETGSAVLTEAQTTSFLELLRNQSGVDFISAPRVSTFSGRQAEVAVLDEKTIVTGVNMLATQSNNTINETLDLTVRTNGIISERLRGVVPATTFLTEKIQIGPVVDVIPRVSPKGDSVQLGTVCRLTEFRGYEDQGTNTLSVQVKGGVEMFSRIPYPRFRIRESATDATVPDGQSLLLAALPVSEQVIMKDKVVMLGDLPVVGRFFTSSQTNTVQKQLLILITPRIVKP